MSALWCDRWDMPAASCAHCRGVELPNLDHVRIPEVPERVQESLTTVVRQLAKRQTAHLDDLARLLLQSAQLYADLADALTGVRTGEDADRVSGGSVEAPLPVDTAVVDHRHLLVRGLRYWCARKPRCESGVLETVPAMVAHLIGHLPDMDAEARTELRSNLLDWRHGVTKVTSGPRLRGKLPLPASCPNATNELWNCTGTVTLLLPADKRRKPWLECDVCKARLEVAELPQAADTLLPVHEAAALLDVSVRTVQRRAARDSGYVRLGDLLEVPA